MQCKPQNNSTWLFGTPAFLLAGPELFLKSYLLPSFLGVWRSTCSPDEWKGKGGKEGRISISTFYIITKQHLTNVRNFRVVMISVATGSVKLPRLRYLLEQKLINRSMTENKRNTNTTFQLTDRLTGMT